MALNGDDETSGSGGRQGRDGDGGDAAVGSFGFGDWLDEGRDSGPAKPPAEPRVVTGGVPGTTDPDRAEDGRFDFGEWLAAGEEYDPADVLEPGLEGTADAAAVDVEAVAEADHPEFDFVGWLSAGEEYDPATVLGEDADGTTSDDEATLVAEWASLSQRPSIGIHPVKAATFALFLAMAVVVGLTVGGLLPALGPAAGLAI